MSRKAVRVLCGFYIYAIMLNGAVGYSYRAKRPRSVKTAVWPSSHFVPAALHCWAFFDAPQFVNLPDRRTAWLGSLGISAAQQVTIMKREVHVSAPRSKMREGYKLFHEKVLQ